MGQFAQLFGQTYPIHNSNNQPHLLTDYLFLAKEDGSKGAPWTRDLDAFKFFMGAAQEGKFIYDPYKGPNGKIMAESYKLVPYIYDGTQKERTGIGE